MKNKTKYLVAILLMLVSFLLIGATNVNAKTTAEVNNYSDLTDKMSDNVTDVVKLTSDITLREDLDTTFSLEMSKTLDFNGFTLTIPQQYKLKLIYYNTLDLKFINSSSRKTAKLNLLTDKNIVVYGHNMRDDSMFGSLKNVIKEEWYDNKDNQYITFITENVLFEKGEWFYEK